MNYHVQKWAVANSNTSLHYFTGRIILFMYIIQFIKIITIKKLTDATVIIRDVLFILRELGSKAIEPEPFAALVHCV